MSEFTTLRDKCEVEGKLGRCMHVKGVGNAEEHWDYCRLTEHESGRLNLCEHWTGNVCENFTSWESANEEWEET